MRKFFLTFAAMALFALCSVASADARAGPGLYGTDGAILLNDDARGGGTQAVLGRPGDKYLNLGDYGLLAGGSGDCTGTAGADRHDLIASLIPSRGIDRTARREVASPPVGAAG